MDNQTSMAVTADMLRQAITTSAVLLSTAGHMLNFTALNKTDNMASSFASVAPSNMTPAYSLSSSPVTDRGFVPDDPSMGNLFGLVENISMAWYDNMSMWNSTESPVEVVTELANRLSARSLPEKIVICIIVTFVAIITTTGNIMVMIAFRIDKDLQTVSNYFLMSLAVADMSIGIVSVPLYSVYLVMGYWPFGPLACDLWLSMDYMMSNASVANLLIISFDRYLSVTRPLTYRAKRTPKRAGILITYAWLISFVMWPPWIFAWPYIDGGRTVPYTECYIQFLVTTPIITVITAIIAFYLPVTIMVILYYRIYRETEKRKKGLVKMQAGTKTKKTLEKGKPSVKESRRESDDDLDDMDDEPSKANMTFKQRLLSCCQMDRDEDDEDDEETSVSHLTSTDTLDSHLSVEKGINKLGASDSVVAKSDKPASPEDPIYTVDITLPDEGTDGKPTVRLEQTNGTTDLGQKQVPEHALQRNGTVTATNGSKLSKQNTTATKATNQMKAMRAKNRKKERKQDAKAAKTLSAILLAFIITWLPYNIFAISETFCYGCVPPELYSFSKYDLFQYLSAF